MLHPGDIFEFQTYGYGEDASPYLRGIRCESDGFALTQGKWGEMYVPTMVFAVTKTKILDNETCKYFEWDHILLMQPKLSGWWIMRAYSGVVVKVKA